jgi:hypothetical protein
MRATLIYGAGDVRVEDGPDTALREPTDVLVRVLRACIWRQRPVVLRVDEPTPQGARIGHDFIGVVEDVGAEVSGFESGDASSRRSSGPTAPGLLLGGRAHLLPPRRPVGPGRRRRWPGRGRPCPAGAGQAGQAARRRGRRAAALAAHPLRRLSTGHHCAVTAGVSPRTTQKPSVGLEPTTPSLPCLQGAERRGMCGHARRKVPANRRIGELGDVGRDGPRRPWCSGCTRLVPLRARR